MHCQMMLIFVGNFVCKFVFLLLCILNEMFTYNLNVINKDH